MDTNVLKVFAAAARLQLLREVASRMDAVLAAASQERRESAGAVAKLEAAVKSEGRQAVVDRVAYTWFNRIIALRFMDANGYNRINVVSPAAGQTLGQPEVMAEAKAGHVDPDPLAGNADRVMDLLTGRVSSTDPQQEAYRLLPIAYCNQLHDPMPFMFEKIGDETELLMPADLLSENSIINQTVTTLTAFALTMKARTDDKRLFRRDIKLNVMALVNSTSLHVNAINHGVDLADYGLETSDLHELRDLFESATTDRNNSQTAKT